MKRFKGVCLWLAVVGAAVCLGLGAGAGEAVNAAEETFACAPEGKVSTDITPKAQLEELSCFFKRFEGVEALHIKVGVKNICKEPQRFRVHIFLDNGKAVGGLIPRTTKKGLIQPGQTAAFVYPVGGMTAKPASMDVKIATVGQ